MDTGIAKIGRWLYSGTPIQEEDVNYDKLDISESLGVQPLEINILVNKGQVKTGDTITVDGIEYVIKHVRDKNTKWKLKLVEVMK